MGTVFLASEVCRKIGKSYNEQLIRDEAYDTLIAAKSVK